MSRLPELYARISPHLAHRRGTSLASRTHARLIGCSGGRVARRVLGAEVLVLRSKGRRSGQLRQSPMFYVTHGESFAVVASNAASERFPAWWLNLKADPDAEVLVNGSWRAVRARAATESEVTELWPRFIAAYSGYDHYKSISRRELPVVLLESR